MGHPQTHPRIRRFLFRGIASAAFLLLASVCPAQQAAMDNGSESTLTRELNKYPELPAELSRLFDKLQQNVQFPSPRAESRLLPLLPAETIFYAAIPNYGETATQSLQIFRQQLEDRPALRDWWMHGTFASDSPKVENSLGRFSELHRYLGEEIVISATMGPREPKVLILSEVRKPGLKKFLLQMTMGLPGKSKTSVRILDPQELLAAKGKSPAEDLFVLVRSDYVVASSNLEMLRGFNARLDSGKRDFASTPFGKRVMQEYRDKLTVIAGADLHDILDSATPPAKRSAAFQQSGFADMQYLVWDHKNVGDKPVSQMELSFSSARHGAASWLASPRPLGSLDFVSPNAMLAGTLVLSSPSRIFDDAKELASDSNQNVFAAIPGFEKALNLSLKDDLLNLLGGEITIELDDVAPPQIRWRATLAVKDAGHLQKTLAALLAASHFETNQVEDGSVIYQTFAVPSGKTTTEITYAFVDGYMIVAPTHDSVAEAVQLHRSDRSLAKSEKFLATLPTGRPAEASALLYQNPIAITALRLRPLLPSLAELLRPYSNDASPAVIRVYGEETDIREVSSDSAFDVAGVLIGAAIAIPNLLRSKVAANEASALGSVRTVNTAQVTYQFTFPQRGYAPNLAALGVDPRHPTAPSSPEHAGLIVESLANSGCTADAWCPKSGFNFRVTAVCKLHHCSDYLVVATPVSEGTGTRSFCSTSDGLIRLNAGPPLSGPLTIAQCKAWQLLQ
jgi:type II secretory pathway pseudopilin PulG